MEHLILTIMATIRFGARDLLEYNPKYCLLICRECQYAIQKNALESHLLRHKIYRGDRQRLLASIAHLDLLEPHHVPLPVPGSPPVDGIPVLSGYRCTSGGCGHLTASSKRMKRHWSEVHGLGGSVPTLSSFAVSVKLQTFFRGTQVRYFEVASSITTQFNADHNVDNRIGNYQQNGNHEEYEEDPIGAITTMAPAAPPAAPIHLPSPPGHTQNPPSTSFDLDTLTYFHHFLTVTSFSLPGTKDSQSAAQYWQMHVIQRALQRHWLMSGLLAISAHHMGTLANDLMTKRIHHERETQFSCEFSTGLGQITDRDQNFEAAEVFEEARQTGEHIRSLLHCAQWALAESMLNYDTVGSCQLQSIMSTIRGCVAPNVGMQDTNNELDGGIFGPARRGMHTVSSSEGGSIRMKSTSNNKPPSALLNHLHVLPFRIAEAVGPPEDAQDVFATVSAVATLVECCNISFASEEVGAVWQGVATWVSEVPEHFNQMVSRHRSASLVVLAHWAAVLVKRAEQVGCWFLRGAAKIILLQVARQLSTHGPTVLALVETLLSVVND